MLWRSVSVVLFSFFGLGAALLGMLPVSGWLVGWPLRRPTGTGPSPWPAPAAWTLAVAVSAFMLYTSDNLISDSLTGNSSFKLAVGVYHVLCRAVETSERCWRRGALCTLARCLRLYCAAHPLSAAGWRALGFTALFITLEVCVHGYWTMWFAGDIARVHVFMWAMYSGSLNFLLLGVAALAGQLTRDLRVDCGLTMRAAAAWLPETTADSSGAAAWAPEPINAALTWASAGGRRQRGRAPQGSSKKSCLTGRGACGVGSPSDALHWRWLRLRHMALLDMNRMACSATCWQVLVMFVFTVTYAATSVSSAVGSFSAAKDVALDFGLRPVAAACARIVFMLYASALYERMALEQNKISQEMQGFLAGTPDLPVTAEREATLFLIQIGLQDAHYDILGMFRLNIGFTKSIVATISTYLVVLMQFNASLY
ncbi:Gustatory and odorant receptor 24 [Frankliniella fusca]|uniref:Gustatory receptor n=1 Tax=Frankliniella fusca TaxID=407009 RepID=A0AAE1I5Q2_9NEOP|nr:Gustatory and odorant receptor 24 [Frankliniella fusca]